MSKVCYVLDYGIVTILVAGLKLLKRANNIYTETDRVFYLFAEDTRGVVRTEAMEKRTSSRIAGRTDDKAVYKINEGDIEEMKKLVFIPNEKYVPKRPQLVQTDRG